MSDDLRVKLMDLDYADRQLVVVRPDDVVLRDRQAALRSQTDAPDPARTTAEVVGVALGATVPMGLAVVNLAARWWLKRTERATLSVLQITRSEARQVNLPAGHPLYDIVYVGNPAVQSTYYSLAEFHRQTFAHKFAEAMTLLASLGASSMRVEAVHGWGRDFAATLDLKVPFRAAGGGFHPQAHTSGSRAFLYTAELKGSGDPRLPRGGNWYPYEPEWQSVADQRIRHDLREFTLHVRYEDDFLVSSDLAATVTKVGLKAGGSFQRHESTDWAITATFPPNQSRAIRAVKHPFG